LRWTRRPEFAAALKGLALTAEEGFVFSRLDVPQTLDDLVGVTGLPRERIDNILSLLEDKGLVMSNVPSMRPAMATIPDADYRERGSAVFVDPLQTGPLADLFVIISDIREPAPARKDAEDALRQRFTTAPPEERAALVVATEAACFTVLGSVALDNRTTSILCARPYNSVAFVKNLARYMQCPAQLLGHLARQPMVQRNSQLKSLLFHHPSMPAEAKRRG
jgi:hypothetical protein